MGFAMRSHQSSNGPPAAIGIDLGTSYARVGLWRDGDVLIIPNERGKLATPSCIAFTSTNVLVGEAAQEQADINLENTIFAPQRLIGFKFENPWVQWYMRSRPANVVRGEDDTPIIKVHDRGKERCLRPEEIVGMLLEHLKRIAERYLGVMVSDAVVTVPAQYGKRQRAAIFAACKIARLKVLDLLKSPTACAIAYCLTNPTKGRRNMLVCDMGGSYFDFSLLVVEEGHLTEKAIGTDYIDLDNCLVRFCLQDLRERFNVSIAAKQLAMLRLQRECEQAKKKLSQYNQVRIELTALLEGVDYGCTISRAHFEEFCKNDIQTLMDPIDWCLEDCGLERSDVHDVVLVGGSARVPIIRRAFRAFFYGREPREVLRPDHAAVLGAGAYVAVAGKDHGTIVPAELQHIAVQQVVVPWSGPDDMEDGENKEGRGRNSDPDLGQLLEELEPPPTNEAANFALGGQEAQRPVSSNRPVKRGAASSPNIKGSEMSMFPFFGRGAPPLSARKPTGEHLRLPDAHWSCVEVAEVSSSRVQL